jgi:dTDP-4-amino-4,6-dideoxygalactose transaminase
VLRVQANRLDEWNARRRQIAAWYRDALPRPVRCPDEDPGADAVYHQFVVRVPRRDAFRAHLDARGVASAVHYPLPLHLQPAYRHLGYSEGDFPVTERLAAEVVSLPMHPFLQPSQIQYIADVAAEFFTRSGAA